MSAATRKVILGLIIVALGALAYYLGTVHYSGDERHPGHRSMRPPPDSTGYIIGETEEAGFPVVFRLLDELPAEVTRVRFGWLTVVSWKYGDSQRSGMERNGMPPPEINSRMIALENAMDDLERGGHCFYAYSRTGNGLKELAYYIPDRERFMGAFNDALEGHPRYPIEIEFFEDREWKDYQTIREMFRAR